jgi:hypothetical protein
MLREPKFRKGEVHFLCKIYFDLPIILRSALTDPYLEKAKDGLFENSSNLWAINFGCCAKGTDSRRNPDDYQPQR